MPYVLNTSNLWVRKQKTLNLIFNYKGLKCILMCVSIYLRAQTYEYYNACDQSHILDHKALTINET